MNTILDNFQKRLNGGFFWFWIKQWRTTILLLVLIVLIGSYSAYRIPKESFPEVNLGMVTITTVYPWGNPEDIDALISKKIEDQITSIEGIDSIDSSSVNNLSTVMATLENDADGDSIANKVQDAIKNISFPADAKDPIVSQIDTNTIGKMMFSLALYTKDPRYSQEYLTDKALNLKKNLEGKGDIDTISLGSSSSALMWWGSSSAEEYRIEVLINQTKLDQLGLSLAQIANLLQGFNASQPLWTHTLGEKEYAFRIEGEKKSIDTLAKTPISLSNGKTVPLESIATLKKVYDDDTHITIGNVEGEQRDSWNRAVILSFNRKTSASVLSASNDAKQRIQQELKKSGYQGLGYFYTQDLWKKVGDLYNDLVVNMISTLLIVFLIVFCFVGSMESFLATVSIPLSFFVTFFVLNSLWYTMNTLTNFSLIICLGIAVDTATVIIQWASENLKKGYKPLHAVLLSVKTYKNSLISGTATTVVVFIPLMMMPWVMGKSLSLIPITLFTTLVASLFISLTITPTIYYLSIKDSKIFKKDEKSESYLSEGNSQLLTYDREGKTDVTSQETSSFRDKILDKIVVWYDKLISATLDSKIKSVAWVITPLVVFIFTISFIAPKIWFLLMPKYDSEEINITLTAEAGLIADKMAKDSQEIHSILNAIPELENYTATIKRNTVTVAVILTDHKKRERTSFDVEAELTQKLQFLKQKGFDITISTVSNSISDNAGEVGIKIKSEDHVPQTTLTKVARDFENYLKGLPGTKNISNSSKESPGQFVFELDEDRLALLGLTKKSVWPSLYLALNGIDAGSVKIDGDTHDITLKYDAFNDTVSPDMLMGTLIPTPAGQIPLANIAHYTFKPAVTSISREDGDISITLGANLEQGVKAETINNQLYAYGDNYQFPEGVSYSKWGEQVENADLIASLLSSIVFAFIMIFAILVLQFDSYTQPLIISYSLLMGFIGASFWMLITWNPYSMMFLIGFVALMGIIVNNAIILIDSANENITHGYSRSDAIKESAKSRLKPILSTTLTTVIGMATLLTNGMFAHLAYTVMFWLSVGTIVTLFAIPVLYQGENKLRILIKRMLFKPLLTIVVPLMFIGILYLLGIMVGIDSFDSLYGRSMMIALLISTILFLIVWEFSRNSVGRAGRRQGLLHLKMITAKGVSFSKKQILKRILIKFWLLFAPLLVGLFTSLIFKFLGVSSSTIQTAGQVSIGVAYLFYGVINLYCFWTSDQDQFLHDKISGIAIVDDSSETK